MRKNSISSIFALDSNDHVLGIVHAADAAKAVETGNKKLEDIIKPARSVSAETPALETISHEVRIRVAPCRSRR